MATVHIELAHHFWQKGEVAVWQSSPKFPTALHSWLKNNYLELVAGSRPKWIERPEGVVYLFFTDEREVHGRMATRLTACWSREQVADKNAVYSQLLELESLAQDKKLSLTIKARIINTSTFNSIIWGLVLLMLVGVGYGAWHLDSTEEDSSNVAKVSQKPIEAAPEKKKSISHVSNKKKRVPTCDLMPRIKDSCMKMFMSQSCSHQTPLNYDTWLKDLHDHKSNDFSGWGCPKSLNDDRDLKANISTFTVQQKKIVMDFLQRGNDESKR